jgi:hypothetical protein
LKIWRQFENNTLSVDFFEKEDFESIFNYELFLLVYFWFKGPDYLELAHRKLLRFREIYELRFSPIAEKEIQKPKKIENTNISFKIESQEDEVIHNLEKKQLVPCDLQSLTKIVYYEFANKILF